MKRQNEKGVSLVEALIAVAILAVTAGAVATVRMTMAKKTLSVSDHIFADQKADQMLNELKALANRNTYSGARVLDGYNDLPDYNLVLTTDKSVTAPGNPLSGNQLANGHWRFLRQVTVNLVDRFPMARNVTVKIFRCEADGNTLVAGLLLATAMGSVMPEPGPAYDPGSASNDPTPIGEPTSGWDTFHYPGEANPPIHKPANRVIQR